MLCRHLSSHSLLPICAFAGNAEFLGPAVDQTFGTCNSGRPISARKRMQIVNVLQRLYRNPACNAKLATCKLSCKSHKVLKDVLRHAFKRSMQTVTPNMIWFQQSHQHEIRIGIPYRGKHTYYGRRVPGKATCTCPGSGDMLSGLCGVAMRGTSRKLAQCSPNSVISADKQLISASNAKQNNALQHIGWTTSAKTTFSTQAKQMNPLGFLIWSVGLG
jgi:hypothetical protein